VRVRRQYRRNNLTRTKIQLVSIFNWGGGGGGENKKFFGALSWVLWPQFSHSPTFFLFFGGGGGGGGGQTKILKVAQYDVMTLTIPNSSNFHLRFLNKPIHMLSNLCQISVLSKYKICAFYKQVLWSTLKQLTARSASKI